jgi:hypothetical protein
MLKQLETNASNKGLGSNLIIIHACAQRASEPFHYGRKRRVQHKRCHVEIAAKEVDAKNSKESSESKTKKAPAKKTGEQKQNKQN